MRGSSMPRLQKIGTIGPSQMQSRKIFTICGMTERITAIVRAWQALEDKYWLQFGMGF